VDEYRRQHDDFLTLGASGDAPRVMTIRGSAAAFTFTELRHDLRSVELASWPRLLLMAHFAKKRCKLRLRETLRARFSRDHHPQRPSADS
jgi:hypothetical protein